MRDELDEEIIKKLSGIRVKAYSYLTDNNGKDKNQMVQKSVS